MKYGQVGLMLRRAATGILLLTLILCADFQIAYAQRVALLPLADVSLSANGINLPVTQKLRDALIRQGFELVPDEDIERFMIQNRIRSSGYLGSFLAYKLGSAFNCSYIFVGTVTELLTGTATEQSENIRGTLGVTLSAFDTISGRQVWGGTRGMSTEEFVGVLGLGGPKDVQDLITPLFDALLHDVTESLDRPDLRAVVPSYQIQDLQLSPEFLRGGDPVNCQLEVNFLDKVPLRIALKTGAREFALIPGPSPGIYQGTVISEQANGPHDVSLVIDWGDKEEPETISNLASYVVVNSPPPLDVTLHKGIEVAGVTFFRNHLVIIPELSRPHLMDRWTVEVKDEKNLTVMTEEHMGNLPSRMVWNGKNKFRRQMKDGLYTFIIKAWDRAGNEVEKAFPVVLQTEPTSLDFQVFYEYNKKFLNVRQVEANAAPVIDWELRVSNSKGKEILQMGGDSFPAVIEIPENFKEGIILCDFNTRDSLGNYLKLKNTKVEIPKDGLYSEDPTFSSINEDGWVDSF